MQPNISNRMLRTGAVLLLFLMAEIATQEDGNQQCRRFTKLVVKEESTLVGLDYAPGAKCRWLFYTPADAPPGTRLKSTCHFNIAPSKKCTKDRVRVWTSGNSTQGDARTFCHKEKVTLLSDGAALELVLDAVRYSPGGSFSCNVTVVPFEDEYDCGMRLQVVKEESTLVGLDYAPGAKCRWLFYTPADAPPGTRLKSTCRFNIPPSKSCSEDRVRVWTSGNSEQGDARTFCGAGNATLLSDGATLELDLHAVRDSPAGSFSCNVTVVPSENECDCGMRKQARVVGGEEAGVNEFPFMAALGDLKEKEGGSQFLRVFCGVSLVSRSFGLTAAHCFFVEPLNLTLLRLAVGDHDLTTDADTPFSKWYRLSNYYPHTKFTMENLDYDIALVRTTEAITMGPGAIPICLPFPFPNRSFRSAKVQIMGWGKKREGGPTSNILQKATVYVESNDLCEVFIKRGGSAGGEGRQICTMSLDGKDYCQSDSGGPIVWHDPVSDRDYILGVSSFGFGCGSRLPAINTRVTAFLDWIEDIVSKEDKLCKDVYIE